MALTPFQTTLLDAINADPALAQYATDRRDDLIAEAFNAIASPAFYVWRTDVTRAEIYHQTSAQGTTWSWTTYKAQNVTEQNAWTQMFMGEVADFSLPNLRAGVEAIFSGTGAPLAQRTHVANIAKRKARRAEKLFSETSGGNGAVGTPATMTWQGLLTTSDISAILNSL